MSKNRENYRIPAARKAKPATNLVRRMPGNPRTRMPRDQSHRSRRAMAVRWDGAEFHWRAGMTLALRLGTFLPTLPRQVLHFFLIDLELVGILHILAEVRDEQAEEIVLLSLEQSLANFVFLGCKILICRRLFFHKLSDHSIAPGGDWPADVPRLERKDRSRASHRTNISNMAVGCNQLACLLRRTQNLCGLFQIMISFRPVR